jgi:hypothetical protein
MFASLNQQDMMCRMFGETLAGLPLDGETGDLLASSGGSGLPKLFTYVRYNAELTRRGLDNLGLTNIQPNDVKRMDSVRHIDELAALGRAVATSQVRAAHFERHLVSAD